MKVVHYRVTLLEPALFDAPGGEPNSTVSHPFIPGSAIRGAVIGAYLRANKANELNAADEYVKRLFFDGSTRYLNATLLDPFTGQRSLPPPLSWQQPKDDKSLVYDTVLDGDRPDTPMKSVKGDRFFAVIDGDRVSLPEIRRTLNAHTQRPRQAQQTGDSRRDGLLFRYDALSRGQSFAGIILCNHDADATSITDLLPGTVTLGGARSAGYGRAMIEIADEDYAEPEPILEGGQQVITLLSDVILRDENGQYTPGLDSLIKALNIPLHPQDVTAVLDTTLAGGFNRKWNLPLPQTPALRAGSVLVLPAGTLSPEQVQALAWEGIGERRAEGFGRVTVNWQQKPEYDVIEQDGKDVQKIQHTQAQAAIAPVNVIVSSDAQSAAATLIDRINTHIDRQKVERDFARRVYAEQSRIVSNPPSRTLIGRLRREIAAELRKPTAELRKTAPDDVLSRFVASIKDKHADKQIQNARIEGRPMDKWMGDMIEEMNQQAPGDVLRFVDTVLERIQQESKQEAES